MSSQNDIGFKSFAASGALTAFTVVQVQADGTIKVAANNTKGNGVLQEDAADGGYASVKLWSAPGTHMAAISGSAVTAATTYGVITGGYIGVVTLNYFVSLETAADGDGTVVEVVTI
tara:strand:+ start:23 stop:373 length:351 start_codon:yes stop_codon:yes gene_type:complete